VSDGFGEIILLPNHFDCHLPLIAILNGQAWKIAGIHATTFIIASAGLD